MIISLGTVDSPEALIKQHCAELAQSGNSTLCLSLNYSLPVWWDKSSAEVKLSALYSLRKQPDHSIKIIATVTDQNSPFEQALKMADASFDVICRSLALPRIDLSSPLLLETVEIAKPWGAEIWYTGTESRGVSTIQGIPLPWVISLNQRALIAQHDAELILLKNTRPATRRSLRGFILRNAHT